MPDFYSVKLDVIGFGQKAHFWNREGPYNAAMHLVSFGVGVPYPKFIESWCGLLRNAAWADVKSYDQRDGFLSIQGNIPYCNRHHISKFN